MNVVSACQGSSLNIFLKLIDLIESKRDVNSVGVYASDSMSFDKVAKANRRLMDGSIKILKEWDIYGKGKDIRPDWKVLAKYENEIADPVFWNVILSDRRVIFGKRCKMRQDYKSRFSYEQMCGILQFALEEVSEFFESIKPDLVISFGTSNIGDYLFYLFAKAKKIPFLQLKSTKIANLVSFNDDIISQSQHVCRRYQDANIEFPQEIQEQAQAYLTKVEKTGVKYEGAILQSKKIDLINIASSLAKGFYADFRRLSNATYRNDNHLETYSLLQLHDKVINPIRYYCQSLVLKNKIYSYSDLDKVGQFVFFPLHFEPEVSMQVFGRPYQNQIELIRHLAMSVPVGFKVVVKEHPRSKGFRSLNYYKKILDIPNTVLVETEISTNLVAKKATLVAMISGSTGLEAAIIGKPVITFGTPVYNILPETMVMHVKELDQLSNKIKLLLRIYQKDESKLKHYVASVIAGAAPVNLYTVLLKKTGRHSEGEGSVEITSQEENDYKRLAEYFNSRIDDELSRFSI